MEAKFFESLRALIIELIENRNPVYDQLTPMLSAYDAGSWAEIDPELKHHNLLQFENVLYNRDGFSGSTFQIKETETFRNLDLALREYKKKVQSLL